MNSEKNNEKGDKLNSFLVRNKKILLIVIVALFIGLIVFATISSVSRHNDEESFMQIISLTQKWEEARQTNATDLVDVESSIVQDLTDLAKSQNGFVSAKAYLLIAEVHFANSNWKEAGDAYQLAYKAGENTYIAPMCLYNAGVCAEELGDLEKAANLYKQCSEIKSFPLVAKVLFSCARIADQQGKLDDAIELYQSVSDTYPTSDWANLAKSRVITLKSSR